MDRDRETFELSMTLRLLIGLRNALLEAITDLVFADSAEMEGLARRALAYMSDAVHHPGAVPDLQNDTLSIRLASADGNDLVLEATRDALRVLAKAVEHVQASLREFELPIRIRLETAEFALLRQLLAEYVSIE